MVPLDEVVKGIRATAEEWLVACTIATEVPPSPMQSSNSQEMFTASMIFAAQQAVAEVIANRVALPAFPNTPTQVVLQPKQFSGTMRGLPIPKSRDIWADALAGLWFLQHVQECLLAWRRVLEMNRTNHDGRLVPDAIFYYSPVSMIPAMRVPDWVAGKHVVPCEFVSSDYFRWFR